MVKQDLPLKLVCAALGLTLLGSLLLSDRYWVLASRPVITRIAEVKVPREIGDPIVQIEMSGLHVPRERSKTEQAWSAQRASMGLAETRDPYANLSAPMLGHSVREWTFLGMPFGYVDEMGPVLFFTSDWGAVGTPLADEAWALLDKANGRDLRHSYFYPFWQNLWGWLFVAGLALAGWLWHRRVVRVREEQGLI